MALLAMVLALLVWQALNGPGGAGKSRLPVGSRVPVIALGERHGLILASDGSLWSWGADYLGWPVLGLGKGTNTSTTLRRIGHETNWVSISAGVSQSLAVKSDGTLWTWGQLVRARGKSLAPFSSAVPVSAAPGNDWKQAAAGGVHSLAIKLDGTLWAWGNNWAGSVGIASTNGSSVPVQVGAATNWVKVWASMLESAGLQSDGTLWYWGDNPDPSFKQDVGRITEPTRISDDTNWVDVGFGVNTVFAIKWDGTLWAWGREAHVYTGAADLARDVQPLRVGTDSDWKAISPSPGWWCQGLIKKDGSLWLMDASDGEPNGPRPPYKPVRFRRVDFQKEYAGYAAGAVHAAGPGVHGPIEVLVTPQGEVWTCGLVLGDPLTLRGSTEALVTSLVRLVRPKVARPPAPAVFRKEPWLLRNE